MNKEFNPAYPSMDDLRNKAMKRIPKFAFEYLDGGCNEDVSIARNTSDIRKVQLQPRYLRNQGTGSTRTKVLGMEFDAPFGIAPV
ncbi:alpha-hydroxy-acid oxidizing protein, partial [Zobellia russellii]